MTKTFAPEWYSGTALLTREPYVSHDEAVDPASREPRRDGVIIGTVIEVAASGAAVVDYPGNTRGPLAAGSVVPDLTTIVGREVVLMFHDGDPGVPIIMGVLQRHVEPSAGADDQQVEARVDGERVTVTGEKEIVLRCGKASITLTRSGKVLIKGEYVLTRAAGVNRIRGGSVQIN